MNPAPVYTVMTLNDKLGLQLRNAAAPKKTETRSQNLVGMSDGERWLEVMGISTGAVNVTETTALSLSAFYRCIDLVSNTLATPSFKVFKKKEGGGRDEKNNHPVAKLIGFRANRQMSAFDWRKAMNVSKQMWGNGVSEIIKDKETNRPTEFKFLNPKDYQFIETEDRVMVQLKDGRLLDEEDYIHWKNFSTDGRIGKGIFGLLQGTLKVQMLAEKYLENYYERGTATNGYISIASKPDGSVLKAIGDTWDERHGGIGNAFDTPVLPLGSEYKTISRSNVESQLMEFLDKSPTHIYQAFGVPPHLASDTSKSTSFGKGIEDITIQYLQYTILPQAVQLEQELNYKVFRASEHGKFYVKLNLRSLERASFVDQAEGFSKFVQAGIYNQNKVLEFLDQNGFDGGDTHMVNGNMIGVTAVPTEPAQIVDKTKKGDE